MASGTVHVSRVRESHACITDEYDHPKHVSKGPMEKKRKLVPTVMDKDVKKGRISDKGKAFNLPSSSPVGYGPGDSNLSQRSGILYSPLELGEVREEQECFKRRDILTSRWSFGSESPTGSCISDSEDMTKKKESAKQMSSSEFEEEYSDDVMDKNDDIKIDEKEKVDAIPHSEYEDTRSENHVETVPNKRCINMLQSCRSVFEYEKLNRISESTYGVVFKARDKSYHAYL